MSFISFIGEELYVEAASRLVTSEDFAMISAAGIITGLAGAAWEGEAAV